MADMWGRWLNRGLDEGVNGKDAVMKKYYSMSQSLPTIHTQKYVLFLRKEYILLGHNISKRIGMQQLHLTSLFSNAEKNFTSVLCVTSFGNN